MTRKHIFALVALVVVVNLIAFFWTRRATASSLPTGDDGPTGAR